MVQIDTLTMYNELIQSGSTKEMANTIVILMNQLRKEFEYKIETLNDRLSNHNK